MVKINRKNLTRKAKKTPKGKFTTKKVSDKPIKDLIKKVIHEQAETKQGWTTFNPTFFNSGINSSGDACRLIPDMTKGTDDNDRVGDQIKVQKFTISGHILFAPQGPSQSDSYRRVACRLMVVSPKAFAGYRSAVDNATTWMSYLIKKGGTTTNFSGLISDLYAPINHDAITSHYDEVFFVNQSFFTSSTGAMAGDMNQSTRFFKINLKVKNKTFKYDDTIDSGLTPSNACYILLCGYVFLDGSSPDTLSTRIQLGYSSMIDYEDS